MSAFEELLYARLSHDPLLRTLLAPYGPDGVAVFERQAPSDDDAGWVPGAPQYPRVDYLVTRSQSPSRKTQGTVHVTVWGRPSHAELIDRVEARIIELLDEAAFHPSDEAHIATRLQRREVFDQGEGDELVFARELWFDLLAHPSQREDDAPGAPDAVETVNRFCADEFSAAGLQVDPAAWAPATDARPMVYWRASGRREWQRWPACEWWDVDLRGHVLAPDVPSRQAWSLRIMRALTRAMDLRMDDERTYLHVMNPAIDAEADPLVTGQLRLVGRYGLAVPDPLDQPPLLAQGTLSGSGDPLTVVASG